MALLVLALGLCGLIGLVGVVVADGTRVLILCEECTAGVRERCWVCAKYAMNR